ncbi:interleukin-1 receptor-associated kinase 1 isoform X2 [Stigmatopora argus]
MSPALRFSHSTRGFFHQKMSRVDVNEYLFNLPPKVYFEFCLVMDGLSDHDWTRFASDVLGDQTNVRLAVRRENRTDYVMNQWSNRNGRVGELLDLLSHHQLFRQRDMILEWVSSSTAPPPAPCPVIPSHFDLPSRLRDAPSTTTAHMISTTGEERALPRPAPPPSSLHSGLHRTLQTPRVVTCDHVGDGVMCWSYNELQVATWDFSESLQVGEGGFGVVFRATLRNMDCAVKRLKQDFVLDSNVLKESFKNEVEKLSMFRHPNIIDLLGYCQGPRVCLIYSYMASSLEDQLHNVSPALAWCLRVRIVHEISTALQFLHFPPDGHDSVIHGDVKSSNILLDSHMVAKLADFGLARFVSTKSTCHPASKTTTLGQTSNVKGTLAYLPEEYLRNGKLGTALDVYSFGVVLLEVLTGRRALKKDKHLGDIYLKDVVQEVHEDPTACYKAAWSKHLDRRLITGSATELVGSMEMVALACRCLEGKWKNRPAMTEVFDKLQEIRDLLPSPHGVSPESHHSSESSVEVLSQHLSKLGPLEDTYQPHRGSLPLPSSSSDISLHSSIVPPPTGAEHSSLPPLPATHSHLHAPSSLPLTSSQHAPSSSFESPCETDESRGFSQYDISTGRQFNSKQLSTPIRDESQNLSGPTKSQSRESSEGQINSHHRIGLGLSHRTLSCPQIGAGPRSDVPEFLSSPAPLQSLCPQTSDGIQPRENYRGPEESDELEYLAATDT